MKLTYGFIKSSSGEVEAGQNQAEVIKLIYARYLAGDSLGKITDLLSERNIPSPTGRPLWSRAVIDDILSNAKYTPFITFEKYTAAQFERDSRTNINYDQAGHPRKSGRYNTTHYLSGLIICEECGANYRRISPASGKPKWRCANQVEHGKSICKEAPTIDEETIEQMLCNVLHMECLDTLSVRSSIQTIIVKKDKNIQIELRK